jgi:hypothetical protein
LNISHRLSYRLAGPEVTICLGEEVSLPEYSFVIRSGEQSHESPRVVELPGGDQAALDYACDLVQQLKKGGGYDDPNLVMLVRDARRRSIFSIPFLAACA